MSLVEPGSTAGEEGNGGFVRERNLDAKPKRI